MATQAQIAANRLNAQSSTGPRTPEGKALASKNSLKHGLSASYDVIATESQEEYDRHRDALLSELDPQTPMESMLANRIVSLSWRLKRADLIQNQTIDVLIQKGAVNPLAKIAKSLGLKGLPIPQPDPADSNHDLILGRIALKDFSNERVLDRILMYERRIEHSLFKTTLELQRLRLLRNLESPQSNPPFSRRRDDDALTPNSTSRQQDKIHPPQAPNAHHASQDTLPGSQNMQNEPNFQNPKTAATACSTKTYNNIPLYQPPKNEPNRTQFRDTQYATRCTLYANLALADTAKTTTIAPVIPAKGPP